MLCLVAFSELTKYCSAYAAYLVFFHGELERLGPMGALNEYIFAPTSVSPLQSPATEQVVELSIDSIELGEPEWISCAGDAGEVVCRCAAPVHPGGLRIGVY
jgi:hypothetical protein